MSAYPPLVGLLTELTKLELLINIKTRKLMNYSSAENISLKGLIIRFGKYLEHNELQ